VRRLSALALALVACGGGGGPTHVVSVVEPPVSAPPAAAPAPAPAPPPSEDASVEVGLGEARLCVRVGGHVHCRASDAHGERPLLEEPAVEGIDDAVSLSVGARHACAVLRDGGVACFGDNAHGQLGAGVGVASSPRALRVKNLASADRVVAGPLHSCARVGGGAVACWGENGEGQTGSSTHYAEAARELVVPTAVAGVSGAASLALSRSVTCALAGAGPVCWGRDTTQQPIQNTPPAAAPWLAGATALAGGGEAVCQATRDGTVACRGSGALVTSMGPVALPPMTSFGVGASHACGLLADRTVRCWGQNYSGQIGRPRSEIGTNVTVPSAVPGLPKIKALAVGGYGACALSLAGELFCWGSYPGAPREGGHEPSIVAIR
jgi:hypothetical protein